MTGPSLLGRLAGGSFALSLPARRFAGREVSVVAGAVAGAELGGGRLGTCLQVLPPGDNSLLYEEPFGGMVLRFKCGGKDEVYVYDFLSEE